MADALEDLNDERWEVLGSGVRFLNLPRLDKPPIPDMGGRLETDGGELARIINGSTIRFVAYIEFDPERKTLRGNHFHSNKTEIIYLSSGSVQVTYLRVDSQAGRPSKTETVLHSTGDLIVIPAGVAHAYLPKQLSHGLELSHTKYAAGDTHEYILPVSTAKPNRAPRHESDFTDQISGTGKK
jgi:mannose-6-phosphate isomerase-like protein (cupin superfamily)